MDYRTDLALERRELIKDSVPEGVSCEEKTVEDVKITRIKIETQEGEKALLKPKGNYITLEMPKLSSNPTESEKEIELIADEIRNLIPKDGTVLIAGLGNEGITPDAVGPKTVESSLATRHVAKQMPQFNFRSVAAIATGVLGQTGIETSDIIKGVCDRIDAKCVIAVDALASKSIKRLGCTVQISDTGICPGSGVGNARRDITEATVGVPVIAVGIPTVVDAITIVSEAVSHEGRGYIDTKSLEGMMVTPREIDSLIKSASKILGLSIGKALQPDISVSDLYFISL